MTQPALHFDGRTYEPQLDRERLLTWLSKVQIFMLCKREEWLSPQQIMDGVGHHDWACISARLRDLRKPKFGGYDIESKRAEGGLYLYRLVGR